MDVYILIAAAIGFVASTAWLLAVVQMTECGVSLVWRLSGFIMAVTTSYSARNEIVYHHLYEFSDGMIEVVANRILMRLMMIVIAIYCLRCHSKQCHETDVANGAHCGLAPKAFAG